MKTITENQRLQLIGLLTLSQSLDRQLSQILRAAHEITEEEGDAGQTADFIYWGHQGIDDPVHAANELLKRLEISVDG